MKNLFTKEIVGLAILTVTSIFLFKWQIQPRFNEVLLLQQQCQDFKMESHLQNADLLPVLEARLKQAQWVKKKLSAPTLSMDPSAFSKQIDSLVTDTGIQLWSFTQEDSQVWRLQLRGMSSDLTQFLYQFEASPFCQVVEQCELDSSPEMLMNLLFRTDYAFQEETLK